MVGSVRLGAAERRQVCGDLFRGAPAPTRFERGENVARPRKTPEAEMPGGEMVEPPKGAKKPSRGEMPGADMNVPVAEELAAAAPTPTRRTSSARKAPARKTTAKKTTAKKTTATKPAARRSAAKKSGGSR